MRQIDLLVLGGEVKEVPSGSVGEAVVPTATPSDPPGPSPPPPTSLLQRPCLTQSLSTQILGSTHSAV